MLFTVDVSEDEEQQQNTTYKGFAFQPVQRVIFIMRLVSSEQRPKELRHSRPAHSSEGRGFRKRKVKLVLLRTVDALAKFQPALEKRDRTALAPVARCFWCFSCFKRMSPQLDYRGRPPVCARSVAATLQNIAGSSSG